MFWCTSSAERMRGSSKVVSGAYEMRQFIALGDVRGVDVHHGIAT